MPSLADVGETAETEISPATKETDGEKEREETVNYFYLEPRTEKHGCDEQDLTTPVDE